MILVLKLIKKSDMSLFADNTKVFYESNISLQSTIDDIYKWLETKNSIWSLKNVKL